MTGVDRVSAYRVVAAGRVQGVNFRYAALRQAERLGLAGWVRNRHDGAVEAFVQGESGSVERFLAWMARGPPHARVDDIETNPAALDDSLDGFDIRF
ncbi:MAG: acylphosphatase [Acidimicrobiia bacterium]